MKLANFTKWIITGCGGGGGGGGSVAPTTTGSTSDSTLSSNQIAREYLIKTVSGNYNQMKDLKPAASIRKNIRQSLQYEDVGVGTVKITAGPADVVTFMDVTYTYTGGSQMIYFRDSYGNLTNNENLVNTIQLDNNNLAANYMVERGLCQASNN